MSGRRGAKHHAEKIRQGFWRALEQLELEDKDGKRLGVIDQIAEVWRRMILDDPAEALQTLAKFTPKELMIDGNEKPDPFVFDSAPKQADLEAWIASHKPQ